MLYHSSSYLQLDYITQLKASFRFFSSLLHGLRELAESTRGAQDLFAHLDLSHLSHFTASGGDLGICGSFFIFAANDFEVEICAVPVALLF